MELGRDFINEMTIEFEMEISLSGNMGVKTQSPNKYYIVMYDYDDLGNKIFNIFEHNY